MCVWGGGGGWWGGGVGGGRGMGFTNHSLSYWVTILNNAYRYYF